MNGNWSSFGYGSFISLYVTEDIKGINNTSLNISENKDSTPRSANSDTATILDSQSSHYSYGQYAGGTSSTTYNHEYIFDVTTQTNAVYQFKAILKYTYQRISGNYSTTYLWLQDEKYYVLENSEFIEISKNGMFEQYSKYEFSVVNNNGNSKKVAKLTITDITFNLQGGENILYIIKSNGGNSGTFIA